ncbi:H-NS family nucleoid-associated regulatory protein [Rodentibacter caecimuris]|uniref:DNA-binding protein n=1 Tax=Rodentibacter caecimuris TaxID=1796644 RepID=A0ABX3KWI9_9PAST|nr:DNA-binding protein H-NS-like protein [Rodentibacter heylii]
MSELIKGLTNLRSLRAAIRELSLEQAESALEKLQLVVNEKRAEISELQKAEQERRQRIEKYRELMIKEGLTAADLADILAPNELKQKNRGKRQPRPAKYQYTDENGNVKTWTGQGRTPRAMQAALDAGKPLSDFEI